MPASDHPTRMRTRSARLREADAAPSRPLRSGAAEPTASITSAGVRKRLAASTRAKASTSSARARAGTSTPARKTPLASPPVRIAPPPRSRPRVSFLNPVIDAEMIELELFASSPLSLAEPADADQNLDLDDNLFSPPHSRKHS
jgi:hypothetical protein